MPYFNKKQTGLDKTFENIELKMDKKFGLTNVGDVSKRLGFPVNLKGLKFKKIARGETK